MPPYFSTSLLAFSFSVCVLIAYEYLSIQKKGKLPLSWGWLFIFSTLVFYSSWGIIITFVAKLIFPIFTGNLILKCIGIMLWFVFLFSAPLMLEDARDMVRIRCGEKPLRLTRKIFARKR